MSETAMAALRQAAEAHPSSLTILQPPGWPKPKGYANGMTAEGKLVFVGGRSVGTSKASFQTVLQRRSARPLRTPSPC